MWQALLTLALLAAAGAQAKPATIVLGTQHETATTYGPADMLCDLNTCRLFNLPKANGLPANAIVEFGMPALNGQDRVDMRRCFQLCRASVLGSVADQQSAPGDGNPTVSIIPTEMRLE